MFRMLRRSPPSPSTIKLTAPQHDAYSAGFAFGCHAGLRDAASNLDAIHRHQVKQIELLRTALLATLGGAHRLVPQVQALDEVINGPLGRAVDSFRTMAQEQNKAGHAKVAGMIQRIPPVSSARGRRMVLWAMGVLAVVLVQAGIGYAAHRWW